MIKIVKPMAVMLALLILVLGGVAVGGTVSLQAQGTGAEAQVNEEPGAPKEEAVAGSGDLANAGKAVGAAIAIGLAALGGALAMGNAISKANEGIARQPEADGKIRTVLMLGLVFIETVVIYALITSILIIFVM
jgi:F-type H+-transporting ATPase subunit c